MKANFPIFCFAMALVMTGCSGVSKAKRAQPSAQIKIVRSYWELIALSIDDELTREKQELRPTGGFASWPEYWQHRVTNLRKGRFSEKGIVYIQQRREQLGLPLLSFH